MVMDGDRVHFLCNEVSRCCVGSGHATIQSAGSGEKWGALSPVCPGGPRVCDDRTPTVSPKPSSQMPGSYCFSPFGCPAKGMEHRQIPSLETQQSLHLVSHRHRSTFLWHQLWKIPIILYISFILPIRNISLSKHLIYWVDIEYW